MKNVFTLLTIATIGLTAGCVADAAHYSDSTPSYTGSPARGYYLYSDGSIHKRVHRALRHAPGVPAERIRVIVSNGDVWLKGRVFNYRQKRRAHDIAHSVAGVNRVFVADLRISRRHRYW